MFARYRAAVTQPCIRSSSGVAAPARPTSRRRSLHTLEVGPGQELTYAMVTPESLAKARVGGIIARLFATPGLEVVGSRQDLELA
jgi:hypothetical protein